MMGGMEAEVVAQGCWVAWLKWRGSGNGFWVEDFGVRPRRWKAQVSICLRLELSEMANHFLDTGLTLR